MTAPAVRIIRGEHQALAAVLHALRTTAIGLRDRGEKPNFEALRALLFYIDAYPERLHHPKEDEHLFKCLRERTYEADAVLVRLERDHAAGEQEIRKLEHQLLEYEMLGERHVPAFVSAVIAYCDRYTEHMRVEEQVLLSIAARVLTEEDWTAIQHEFEKNRDPLTGHEPTQEFAELFRRIVRLLPAPLGVGPEMA